MASRYLFEYCYLNDLVVQILSFPKIAGSEQTFGTNNHLPFALSVLTRNASFDLGKRFYIA
jgi:hypothetical protein